jgi:hypothetical protein
MATVNFDSNGNIISVTQGQKEPIYYPQITIPDGMQTAGMVVDVTQDPPVLKAAGSVALAKPSILSGIP